MFEWSYETPRAALVNLYEKGERLQWNATTDVDWSVSVDPEAFPEFRPPEMFVTLNPPRNLELRELKELLMREVFDRMGFDVEARGQRSLQTPFMGGFRQILFSKIVPNLRRLGLLTPRVGDAFGKVGVLHFEALRDSTENDSVTIPPQVLAFIGQVVSSAGRPA